MKLVYRRVRKLLNEFRKPSATQSKLFPFGGIVNLRILKGLIHSFGEK